MSTFSVSSKKHQGNLEEKKTRPKPLIVIAAVVGSVVFILAVILFFLSLRGIGLASGVKQDAGSTGLGAAPTASERGLTSGDPGKQSLRHKIAAAFNEKQAKASSSQSVEDQGEEQPSLSSDHSSRPEASNKDPEASIKEPVEDQASKGPQATDALTTKEKVLKVVRSRPFKVAAFLFTLLAIAVIVLAVLNAFHIINLEQLLGLEKPAVDSPQKIDLVHYWDPVYHNEVYRNVSAFFGGAGLGVALVGLVGIVSITVWSLRERLENSIFFPSQDAILAKHAIPSVFLLLAGLSLALGLYFGLYPYPHVWRQMVIAALAVFSVGALICVFSKNYADPETGGFPNPLFYLTKYRNTWTRSIAGLVCVVLVVLVFLPLMAPGFMPLPPLDTS